MMGNNVMINTNKRTDFAGVLVFEILILGIQIYMSKTMIESYLNSNLNVL